MEKPYIGAFTVYIVTMQQKKYATCNAGKWKKKVMSTLLEEQKKNKSIKWIKIIMEQSGRDMTQTRNDKKINNF